MFTFKFFLKPTSKAIQLRITNNRKKVEWSLGYEATAEQLDDALSDSPKVENIYLSSTLGDVRKRLKEIQLDFIRDNTDLDNMEIKQLGKLVKGRISASEAIDQDEEEKRKENETKLFGKFYEKRMNAKANKGYKASIESTFKKMQAFCADKDSDHGKPFDELTFEDISLRWLNAFDEWMVKDDLKQNSRNIHFKNIRTVINRAIDEELTEKYPFRRFKIHPEETRKRSMTIESLRELFDYPVEEYQKIYLDMFKLIFMLIGINSTDLYNLTEIVDGRIEYRRAKTHRLYSIKVEPEAMEIIERWKGEKNLLCIADRWPNPKEFNKYMNITLKKIGKRQKVPGRGGKIKITPAFPELQTYWARHSWATLAADLDIPDATISLALGHSGGTNPTTAIYIKRDLKKMDEANRRVLNYVLYGKE
ncbi:MAG: site-specific integrase [Muribaculaceae bacterium]|nr:site-specific integrase [Muribaculaceae bacterium]